MPPATRAAAPLSLAVVLAALCATATVGANHVIEVDFFRAMESSDVGVHELGNNDLASLVGVLKYVHTETIAEHTISPVDRPARKYGIDVIAKWSFQIKNPEAILDPRASTVMVQQVDFGPYTTFDHGVATNTVQQDYVEEYGDFVGVQLQRDERFRYSDPYYWYSISGFCPNLEWGEKGSLEAPAEACLNYTAGGKVQGGLCPNWEDGVSLPTGEPGCTYTYRNSSTVQLDALAGITQQDCGGRLCTDWADFRQHCSDASLRRSFDANTGRIEEFAYCVEYDVSPACEGNCNAPACLALPEDERELGLPFWRGRCSDAENKRRAEAVATAFGASPSRHVLLLHSDQENERCMYPGGMCNPNPQVGGMYCSREWAGVCQPCFVPGADRRYPAQDQPYCPYNVLRSVDYRGHENLKPQCNSTRPRDLCCLYTDTCTGSFLDGNSSTWPTDADGFALAAFQQNTTVMKEFLERVAFDNVHGTVENSRLEDIAYWAWDHYPKQTVTLASVEDSLRAHADLFPTTTTMTTTATTSTSDEPSSGASSMRALLTVAPLCAAVARLL